MIQGIIARIIDVFVLTWWVVVPAGLFFVWQEFWVIGMRMLFIRKMKWVLLEIRIPKDVLKTPKAMESVFSSMHALYTADPSTEEVYL